VKSVTITYQKKIRILVWGSFILILICYMAAFRKTFDERKTLKSNRNVASVIENSSVVHGQLLNELSSIDTDLSNFSTSGKETQEIVIELINEHLLNYRVKLIEMPGQESCDQDGISISNQVFTVQGDFISLLRFLRSLEETPGAGKIASVDFYRFSDKQSGFSATRAKFYLQNIKKKKG
jgi:hypothetical protein